MGAPEKKSHGLEHRLASTIPASVLVTPIQRRLKTQRASHQQKRSKQQGHLERCFPVYHDPTTSETTFKGNSFLRQVWPGGGRWYMPERLPSHTLLLLSARKPFSSEEACPGLLEWHGFQPENMIKLSSTV